ncbi:MULTISPECIES: hypothetical protein [Kordiimonas]|uniref:hypothetical protein n=1 Tax=Kordiimonas TaxID=288021 RepID=UPI001FF5751C|nr:MULTISPECIES: hypothetical protein [Kordiimonas]MCK0067853.1 hypothetical protein [Kordiimonas laminariae]UTW60175.1 hypothetical protein KFE96_07640 [Kordiimonas sp. SCSIO 12603]
MKKSHKLLILDDDLHYTGMLALKLKARFPELKVSSSTQKTLIHGYDIYILDNDFNGQKCGARLAEQVREQAPDSLVIILSGTLELELLKRLVNCHTAGVFDKGNIDELQAMNELIEAYIQSENLKPTENKISFAETFSGISDMISEWNKKLTYEEKR